MISNLGVAMEAKKNGANVGVIFTQEALAALCNEGTFTWSPQLTGQAFRLTMADNAAAMGIPTRGGRGEGRQIDVRQLIEKAKEEGVPMYACPAWAGLMGLKEKLPAGIREIDLASVIKAITEAKTVIGTL
jgi:peroxiredoxin family protein